MDGSVEQRQVKNIFIRIPRQFTFGSNDRIGHAGLAFILNKYINKRFIFNINFIHIQHDIFKTVIEHPFL